MCDDNNTSTLDGGHRGGGHDHGLTRRGAIGAGAAGGVALLFAGIKGTSSGALLDALGPEVTEAAAGTCTMTPARPSARTSSRRNSTAQTSARIPPTERSRRVSR